MEPPPTRAATGAVGPSLTLRLSCKRLDTRHASYTVPARHCTPPHKKGLTVCPGSCRVQLRPPPRPLCAPPAPVAVSAAASRQTGAAANLRGPGWVGGHISGMLHSLQGLTDSALTVRVPRACCCAACTRAVAARTLPQLCMNLRSMMRAAVPRSLPEETSARQKARGRVGQQHRGHVCRRVPAAVTVYVAAGQRADLLLMLCLLVPAGAPSATAM